jgi:hypothetical protein
MNYELHKAIPMPNVNRGTNRLIHRKIKDLKNKLTYESEPQVDVGYRWCKQSYRLRSCAQRDDQREVEISPVEAARPRGEKPSPAARAVKEQEGSVVAADR